MLKKIKTYNIEEGDSERRFRAKHKATLKNDIGFRNGYLSGGVMIEIKKSPFERFLELMEEVEKMVDELKEEEEIKKKGNVKRKLST